MMSILSIAVFYRLCTDNFKYPIDIHISFCTALFLFTFAAIRVNGPDFITYSANFYALETNIPDNGFVFLINVSRKLGLSFNHLLFVINLIVLYSLVRTSDIFKVPVTLVIFIYLSHLFVVRDLAQFRSSLAVALFLLSIKRSFLVGLVFNVLAVSMHFSVLPLFLAFFIAKYFEKLIFRKFGLFCFIGFLSALIISQMVTQFFSVLGILDGRVLVYLDDNTELDSRPTSQFFGFFLFSGLILYSIFLTGLNNINYFQKLGIVVSLFALKFWVAFGLIPVVGPRLFNVLLSFYPYILAGSISNPLLQTAPPKLKRWARASICVAILSCLMLRPSNFDLLAKIEL